MEVNKDKHWNYSLNTTVTLLREYGISNMKITYTTLLSLAFVGFFWKMTLMFMRNALLDHYTVKQ